MGTPTLFGDAEDIAPARTPPPEAVVRELVALGVAEATARGWESRQAFAVLARRRKEAAAAPARPAPAPAPTPAPPPPPPPKRDRGASLPERQVAAAELAAMLPEGEDRGIPWERRCGRVAAGLYVLTPVEWDEVVRGVVDRLRADAPTTPEGPTVKAISLHQPWASLVAHGLKRVETRHWPTEYRGPLLIHAARHWTGEVAELCHRDPAFRAALERMGHPINSYAPGPKGVPVPAGMPFGAIVGRVELVGCYPTEDVDFDHAGLDVTPHDPVWQYAPGKLRLWHEQEPFGDFGAGRFAWLLADPVRFDTPVPYRGHQGFFDVPETAVSGVLPGTGKGG